jgi:hypothetical protein
VIDVRNDAEVSDIGHSKNNLKYSAQRYLFHDKRYVATFKIELTDTGKRK